LATGFFGHISVLAMLAVIQVTSLAQYLAGIMIIMMFSSQCFSCIALLAMNRSPLFPPLPHLMESLAASLPGGVSIPLKHAAITIARTAQNLADFGIVDVLPRELGAHPEP
jgi:hypothetical protein